MLPNMNKLRRKQFKRMMRRLGLHLSPHRQRAKDKEQALRDLLKP